MSDDKHSPFCILHSPLVPPGYKQTEVGVIPEDWEVTTVGEISDVKTGPFGSVLHERDYVNDGTPIITVEHLGERGVLHTNLPMVSDADKTRLKAYSLRQGDIVFSRVGSVDRNALITADEEGWLFSGRLLRARIKNKGIEASYLSYHFHSEAFKQRVRDVAVGQTMASINTQILMGVKTVLPPTKAEQEAIAEALSDADALIESLEQLIAKKRQIKQGAMQELLTGKKRLSGFATKPGYKQTEVGIIPEDWEVTTVGEVSDVKTGPFGSALHEKDYVNNGTPIITVEHLGESGVHHTNLPMVSDADKARLKAYTLHQGDIVFSRVGSVDRNALIKVAEDGWLFSGRLLRVRLKGRDTDAPYLSYNFHSEAFKQRVRDVAVGQTMASINTQILMGVKIILPPTTAEQTAIAAILSDIDMEITALEEKLTKACQIKQGMMQELLTGKTRLIENGKWSMENALG